MINQFKIRKNINYFDLFRNQMSILLSWNMCKTNIIRIGLSIDPIVVYCLKKICKFESRIQWRSQGMASRQMPGVSEDLLIKNKNFIFYRFTCLYSFPAFNNDILPYLDNNLPYCFGVWVGILPDRVCICRIELAWLKRQNSDLAFHKNDF